MRKSIVESDFSGKTVEHVELWTAQTLNDVPKSERVGRARVEDTQER